MSALLKGIVTTGARVEIASADAPLVTSRFFPELKDPSLTYDGHRYHLYGTGCLGPHRWGIYHFVSPYLNGPWQELPPCTIDAKGPQICAPSVVFEAGVFHMFLQTACFELGWPLLQLVSTDGSHFRTEGPALAPPSATGFYDVEAVHWMGEHYLTYTAMNKVGHGDIYLAKSRTNSWFGPWDKAGCILDHIQVPFHNQHSDRDYEWGLEGAQVIRLNNGRFLLTAVCFLQHGRPGRRQRLFTATADHVQGPYLGSTPVIEPSRDGWDCGENGHGCSWQKGDDIHVFFQARRPAGKWNIGTGQLTGI